MVVAFFLSLKWLFVLLSVFFVFNLSFYHVPFFLLSHIRIPRVGLPPTLEVESRSRARCNCPSGHEELGCQDAADPASQGPHVRAQRARRWTLRGGSSFLLFRPPKERQSERRVRLAWTWRLFSFRTLRKRQFQLQAASELQLFEGRIRYFRQSRLPQSQRIR